MSKGVLIFAHNNSEIDYLKIACANALMVQRNLGVNVTLVTDKGTHSWGKKSLGKDFLLRCFENILYSDGQELKEKNIRRYRDGAFTEKNLQFLNQDHWRAYELSPYDETLFIDADYLIMSDSLNKCWGSVHDVMINSDVKEVMSDRQQASIYVENFGIRLYWATCVYFKKSPIAETFFKLVKDVYENYIYYRQLYLLPPGLFRNDYAFSIAVHVMNNFTENRSIAQLPIPYLLKVFDNDDIADVKGLNDFLFYLEKPGEAGNFVGGRVRNQDVHIMNKWAITRNFDKIRNLYE